MAKQQPPLTGFCSQYQSAVELIGRRWTGAIIRMLMSGPLRYAELANGIPEISDRMLAERLRELESERIVVRRVVPEIPVRVEYELTAKGHGLEGPIRALAEWAERWTAQDGSAGTSKPADRKATG